MTPEVIVELMKWQLGILGGGIAILIAVVGYFAHKLVATQEEQGRLLVEHSIQHKEVELRLRHLEARR